MDDKEQNVYNNSSNILNNIDTYVENIIEKKINQIFDVMPQYSNVNAKKMIYDYNISELYNNTIETVIDIIDDITKLMADKNYISSKTYWDRFYNIIFKEDRKIYVGIILVILSFILYFIDGAST
jgi:translation initiation factor 2 beta subunit (eIF-2beta)/eIF-5